MEKGMPKRDRSALAMDPIFESTPRSSNDLAGVFEYDGETGYFYLYRTSAIAGQKVVGAIPIFDGEPDFEEGELTVRWDAEEQLVALLIAGQTWAAFHAASGAAYGGNYRRGGTPIVPQEVRKAFESPIPQ